MQVVFRVDASLDIGTGHVMRCLTLAESLRKRGVASRFICRAHAGNLLGAIGRRGHDAVALRLEHRDDAPHGTSGVALPAHAGWLGAAWEDDARQTMAALPAAVTWLVVDHYALDARWEATLRRCCPRVMAIDDLADRLHDCDLLLDQNLGRLEADYRELVPASARVLAGPHYALVRPEFSRDREASLAYRNAPSLQRILVGLGGVDKDNVTQAVLEALAGNVAAGTRVSVVMGPHAPWISEVRSAASRLLPGSEVLVDVGDMAALMRDSDLSIGAAGSTSWERCTLGLPSVLVVLAENQRGIAAALESAGAALSVTVAGLRPFLRRLLQAADLPTQLGEMSLAARQVTDGRGAERVSELLCSAP